jgi:pentatricopeptide repeat domain-containing protein 1
MMMMMLLQSWLVFAILIGPQQAILIQPHPWQRIVLWGSPKSAEFKSEEKPKSTMTKRQLRQRAKARSYFQKEAIMKLGKRKSWSSAVHELNSFRAEGGADVYAFGAAIAACARAGQYVEALELLQVEMVADGVPVKLATCNAALLACERAGRWREGLKLLRAMQEGAQVRGQQKQKQKQKQQQSKSLPQAEARAEAAEAATMTAGSHITSSSSDISSHLHHQLPLLAAPSTLLTQHYPPPNLYSFNAVLGACAGAKSEGWRAASAALGLLSEMNDGGTDKQEEQEGQAPSKGVGVEEAAAVPEVAPAKLTEGLAGEAVTKGVTPAVVAVGTTLPQLHHHHHHHHHHPDDRSFSLAIQACGAAGDWRRALGVWEALRLFRSSHSIQGRRPVSVRPSGGRNRTAAAASSNTDTTTTTDDNNNKAGAVASVFTLSSVLYALAEGGQVDAALAVLDSAYTSHGVSPNVVCVNAALHACAKGGRWREALDLLDGLKEGRWEENKNEKEAGRISSSNNNNNNNIVENRSSGSSSSSKSSKITAKSTGGTGLVGDDDDDNNDEENSGTDSGGGPDVVSYGAAISACSKAGEWGKALELLGGMALKDGDDD